MWRHRVSVMVVVVVAHCSVLSEQLVMSPFDIYHGAFRGKVAGQQRRHFPYIVSGASTFV